MWDTNFENYDTIIDKIISDDNNKSNNNNNKIPEEEKDFDILFDKIVKIKTQEIKGILNKANVNDNANDNINTNINKELKIIYLSEENTNRIFTIGQIEKENFEYFEEFNIFNNENENQTFNLNLNINFSFKNYFKNIVNNTKVINYNSNGTYGHFIFSDENSNKENLNKEKKPLIYFLHGGPNGNISKQFLLQHSLFLANGYSILVVNYIGSSGYGQEYLNSLNGKIGELDVKSCGEYLINFLNEKKDEFNLDEKNIIAFGGSHGGFLGAWLVCHEKYNKFFSSAILRNPVIDLSSMLVTTDIPDWVLGFSSDIDIDLNFPPGEEVYKDFYKKSPIFSVRNCKTPTLINLGMKDLRVNYFNGLFFYKALKSNNCITKLTMHPEDNHPLNSDETDIDNKFNGFYWIKENLRK
jgi:acetyl esterase/lipase